MGATIKGKTVGCESISNLEKAQELQGTKHFIKFLVMGKCQVLQQDSSITLLNKKDNFYKIRSFNQRELWIAKSAVLK